MKEKKKGKKRERNKDGNRERWAMRTEKEKTTKVIIRKAMVTRVRAEKGG